MKNQRKARELELERQQKQADDKLSTGARQKVVEERAKEAARLLNMSGREYYEEIMAKRKAAAAREHGENGTNNDDKPADGTYKHPDTGAKLAEDFQAEQPQTVRSPVDGEGDSKMADADSQDHNADGSPPVAGKGTSKAGKSKKAAPDADSQDHDADGSPPVVGKGTGKAGKSKAAPKSKKVAPKPKSAAAKPQGVVKKVSRSPRKTKVETDAADDKPNTGRTLRARKAKKIGKRA